MQIRLENLQHTYHSPTGTAHQVLNIADWQLESGQQVLIRGVSGSGKTTLFNVLSGLLRPTNGTVFFDDIALHKLYPAQCDRFRAQYIGYIFQNHYLLNQLSAIENVVMPMAFAKQLSPAQRRKRAQQLLEQVGLAEFVHYRPRQLSTGQRLRVAVARALANKPHLLLADEPTAALDADSTEQVMDLIQASCREQDAILLIASHDPKLSERFEMVVNLQNGRLSMPERALA